MKSAFKVKNTSEIYKQYFENLETKIKANNLIKDFKKQVGILSESVLYTFDFKTIGVMKIDYEQFKNSLKKKKMDDFYLFKENAAETKLWQKMTNGLTMHDLSILNIFNIPAGSYYWDFFSDNEKNLYLIIECPTELKRYNDQIVEPIQLSEYYAIIEDENRQHG